MATIADFPLIWRWTSPKHALFSPAELAGLHPCSGAEAAHIYLDSRPFATRLGLDPRWFSSVLVHDADTPVAEGCSWLRGQCADLTEQVTLSWDRGTALRTNWEFFTAQWDDFCYPLSDDVLVLPDSARWVLFYHHAEIFYFGNRNASLGITAN